MSDINNFNTSNAPTPSYVEFDSNTEGRIQTTILHDQYYTKWKAMSPQELDDEYQMLADKLNSIPNEKIYKQILEVMDLLGEYKKRKPEEGTES